MTETLIKNRRILIIDDNPDIHGDFQKILAPTDSSCPELSGLEAVIFGDSAATVAATTDVGFQVDGAMQGQDGLTKVTDAVFQNKPYFLSFVDMRMPPGWDGLETIRHIRKIDQKIFLAICTAHSEYTFEQIKKATHYCPRVKFLRKPFDPKEITELATRFMNEWHEHESAAS
jgi:two-component system, NtrC family, sensor kinase